MSFKNHCPLLDAFYSAWKPAGLQKHLSKLFLNDNGTCNSIAINVHTYLVAFMFFQRCRMIFCAWLKKMKREKGDVWIYFWIKEDAKTKLKKVWVHNWNFILKPKNNFLINSPHIFPITRKHSVHLLSSYSATFFLKRKRPTYKSKNKKCSRRKIAAHYIWENGDFDEVWPPARSRPISVQKDQVISYYALRREPFRWPLIYTWFKKRRKKVGNVLWWSSFFCLHY